MKLLSLPSFLLSSLVAVRAEQDSRSCELACTSIAKSLPNQLFYQTEAKKFQLWDAKQTELEPACYVEPSDAAEVALIVEVLVREGCRFAVKSGGHSRDAGQSNVRGGVAIDLGARLNNVELSADKTSAKLGAGASWLGVYRKLEQHDLMVVGGRDSDVGVGGYTLGGGISYFSRHFGFSSDNVLEYELVLPNATVVTVSANVHPDLYFALRGGGNNFGIVTSFRYPTFAYGKIWGGSSIYTFEKKDSLLEAYHTVTSKGYETDLDAAMHLSFGYNQPYDMMIAQVQTMHLHPEPNPPVYDEFRQMESMFNTLRVDALSNFTAETSVGSPPGLRNIYKTISYRPSRELNSRILDIFIEAVEPLKPIAGSIPFLIFQPLSASTMKLTKSNGGNAMGLDEKYGPLTIMLFTMAWASSEDDALVHNCIGNLFDRVMAAVNEAHLLHPWIYLNYASSDQDVFGGYDRVDYQRLRAISREVDPRGVFAKNGLCNGQFKVSDHGIWGSQQPLVDQQKEQIRDEL